MLLGTLAACSDSGGSGKGGDASPEPVGKRIRTAAQLGTLCSDIGKGHPKAAEYTGDGPHRTAVFQTGYRTGRAVAPVTALVEDVEFRGLPEVSKTTPVSAVELLACAEGKRGTKKAGTCDYAEMGDLGNKITIPKYTQGFTYTVYELRTGRVVKTVGKKTQWISDCPKGSAVGRGADGNTPDKVYGQLSDFDAQRALKDLAAAPAR
ncbi:hypothetical protein GCM10009801_70520 [Streptomyces albiaxialis]|uniref:Lipoprotein n=1 Tax=Streptomyces albiaxialis TaxID=329523 RepID=A0ABN2WU75_9ACTN